LGLKNPEQRPEKTLKFRDTAMSDQPEKVYLFGPFRLEPAAYRLLRAGVPVHLRPKAFDTLVYLVEKRGRLVGVGELTAKVWLGEARTDNTYQQAIKDIRKALGKRPDGGEYVENVAGKGYRFTADVEEVSAPPTQSTPLRRSVTNEPRRYLVGREEEVADLWRTFESVQNGGGHLLCVTGEPGIGKTTLTEHFLSELSAGETAETACKVAKGNCSERLVGTGAYLPFIDALESLIHGGGGETVAREMKQLAPSWYAQLNPVVSDAPPADAPLANARLAPQEILKREMAVFLQKISSREPLVLLFEDVHWADKSTIDLVAYLTTKFDSIPALVLMTYRPTEIQKGNHPFLYIQKDLQTRGLCHELKLSFWGREEIQKYLELEFPGRIFSAEFLKLIHGTTEGSPLFVVDLMRYLREENELVEDRGQWGLAEPALAIEGNLPASILSMIERKIDHLSQAERQVLDVACVQGCGFDSAVVSEVLDLDPAEVEHHLYNLERVHAFVQLIEEQVFPGGQITQRYQFVHLLYQNQLYAMLGPSRRATLSGAVARSLLSYYGDQSSMVASELALLFKTAREFRAAFHYLSLAAHNAVKVSAYGEAYTVASRGLEIKDSVPESPEKNEDELALLNTLGMSIMAIKGFAAPKLKEIYERSVEICERSGDSRRLPIALYGLWVFHIDAGRLEIARGLGERILELAKRLDDTAVLVEAQYALGTTLLQLGELRGALRHLTDGVSNYDRERHASNCFFYQLDPCVACLSASARTLWLLGFPDKALQKIKDALELARQINHPESRAYALTFVADIYHFRGEVAEAVEYIDQAIKCSLELGLKQELSWAQMMNGWMLVERGRKEEGVAELQRHLAHYRKIGSEVARSKFLGLLALALGRARKIRDGISVLDEAFDFVRFTGERYYESELYRIKGELLLLLPGSKPSPRTKAEEYFLQAVEIARQQGAKSLELRAVMSLARLYRRQNRPTDARPRLEEVYKCFTEGFDTADLKEAKALLEELS
jgi:predicted ATPase/DNA-binding winged helix-turn-helix (wHTH) protein